MIWLIYKVGKRVERKEREPHGRGVGEGKNLQLAGKKM